MVQTMPVLRTATGGVLTFSEARYRSRERTRCPTAGTGDGATGDAATGDGATGDAGTGDGATGDGATGATGGWRDTHRRPAITWNGLNGDK